MYRLSVILSVHHGTPFYHTNEYAVTVIQLQLEFTVVVVRVED